MGGDSLTYAELEARERRLLLKRVRNETEILAQFPVSFRARLAAL